MGIYDIFCRVIQRNRTLLLCCIAGLGGIAPDFDHFFSIVFNKPEWWGVIHRFPDIEFILWWCCLAFAAGCVARIILKRDYVYD